MSDGTQGPPSERLDAVCGDPVKAKQWILRAHTLLVCSECHPSAKADGGLSWQKEYNDLFKMIGAQEDECVP